VPQRPRSRPRSPEGPAAGVGARWSPFCIEATPADVHTQVHESRAACPATAGGPPSGSLRGRGPICLLSLPDRQMYGRLRIARQHGRQHHGSSAPAAAGCLVSGSRLRGRRGVRVASGPLRPPDAGDGGAALLAVVAALVQHAAGVSFGAVAPRWRRLRPRAR
jgi:hypothetical protein